MRLAVVTDLDGTLCNDGHRQHLAKAKQWDEFHGLLANDEPWQDVRNAINALSVHFDIIALTARNERYRTETMAWLHRHMCSVDVLLMRPDNNFDSSEIIKERLLAEHFGGEGASIENSVGSILCMLEDRDKVVEHWRNLGFRCWQVQPGGY